ncbi:hypothetical protein CHI14_09410 [Paenibacillus sp. 7516]|nr:hypothetical protein [Paenibacillus sp. 7516]PAF32112.1 hypothetical protein CHI14_09410 [Paenibacillus sp. 7516]
MTQTELYNGLEAIGYPVAYSHFKSEPKAPYLVYLFAYDNDFMADNVNYAEIPNFQVELYTEKKDPVAEEKVKAKLKEMQLPYNRTETYLESENMFQMVFTIQLIGG